MLWITRCPWATHSLYLYHHPKARISKTKSQNWNDHLFVLAEARVKHQDADDQDRLHDLRSEVKRRRFYTGILA